MKYRKLGKTGLDVSRISFGAVGINIPQLLKLLNRWEAFKNVNWAQMHLIRDEYYKIAQKADAYLACEQCVARCPYNLPVPEMMKTISRSL